jgi:hypothetical protein
MIDGGRAASADNLGVLMPGHGILRLKPAGRLERRSQQFPTPDLFSTEDGPRRFSIAIVPLTARAQQRAMLVIGSAPKT